MKNIVYTVVSDTDDDTSASVWLSLEDAEAHRASCLADYWEGNEEELGDMPETANEMYEKLRETHWFVDTWSTTKHTVDGAFLCGSDITKMKEFFDRTMSKMKAENSFLDAQAVRNWNECALVVQSLPTVDKQHEPN